MNSTVQRIVELLFQHTAMNEETKALKDEVMNNCQERYGDMVARGYTEEEATEAVVDSLKGMEEVLAQYPQVEETTADKADAFDPADFAKEEDEDAVHFVRVLPESLKQRRLQVNLKETDVQVKPSDGHWIEVFLPSDGHVLCRTTDSGIMLEPDYSGQKREKPHKVNFEAEYNSFSDLMRDIGKLAGQLAQKAFIYSYNGSDEPVEIKIPAGCMLEGDIRTLTGDVTWEEVPVETLRVSTTSGDVSMELDGRCPAKLLDVNTASGDIRVEGQAEEVTLRTMSGDITLEGKITRNLSLQSVSGDVEFLGMAPGVQVKTTSGDAHITLREGRSGDFSVHSTSGDVTLRLPTDVDAVDLTMRSVSGDSRVRGLRNDPASPFHVSAVTVSGDVEVR